MRQAGGGRRASMVSLLIGLCVFASTDLFEFVCADWANRLVPRATACSPTSSEQLPQYVAAAGNAPAFDKGSVADYSDAILSWWRTNGTAFPTWAEVF